MYFKQSKSSLTRRLPGLFCTLRLPGGGGGWTPLEIARMLPDFYHLWLIRSGSTSSTGGTKKNFGFWPILTAMTSFSVWWRHMTRKEEIRNIAIKTLFINVQKAATYQNVRIDSVYLLHTQILRYDVILTSLWRHFRVWYKWHHCDVIFGQKNLKKIMEIAEPKSFISYVSLFLLSLLEKKLQRF